MTRDFRFLDIAKQRDAARTQRPHLWLLRVVWMSVVCLASVGTAHGVGTEQTSTSDDLVVQVDSRWTGNANGGYFPIRVRLVNRGPARQLTFRFASQSGSMPVPTVVRSVTADQNATVRFTLSIPIVNSVSFGTLEVADSGHVLKNHTRQIQLPDASNRFGSSTSSPSLLLISASPVDFTKFQAAVQARTTGSSAPHGFPGGYAGRSADCEVVGPTTLPESWIDYSGLDLVAVSRETFAGLPAAARDAITQWVHCGGNLVVFGVGPEPARRDELASLLAFESHRFAETSWKPTTVRRERIAVPQTDEFGNPLPPGASARSGRPGVAVPARPGGGSEPAPVEENFVWSGTPEDFVSRELMLGKVFAFKDNPFPGSIHDWAWFLRSVGEERLLWDKRHGMSAREDHGEFLKFLNPGVRGAPTYMFLVLITLFAVAIGPVNYLLLQKRRKLYLLVVTVPAIAFLTSASLLSYSVIAHGFGVKSRLRSLTFLDQPARTSVTTARLALYAGMAPSGGLRFSSETAVFPIWPRDVGFESGTVNWTETQNLESGWLRSRTHTQFLTTAHSAARGRLDVEPPKGEQITVANGHEWDIEALIVADDAGRTYAGSHIPAGAAATLEPAATSEFEHFRELLNRYPPEVPAGIDTTEQFSLFDTRSRYRAMMRGGGTPASFATNLMERRIAEWKGLASSRGKLPPRSYLAVFHDNPGVETGLKKTQEDAGYHLMLGFY